MTANYVNCHDKQKQFRRLRMMSHLYMSHIAIPGAAESTINTISLIVFLPITFSKYFSKKVKTK